MKWIKKIAVTPVTPNTGDIIDSFSTTDDKTKNAPSIRAVEAKISTELNTFQKVTTTATGVSTNTNQHITIQFKRIVNTVFVHLSLSIDGDENETDEDTITLFDFADQELSGYGLFTMPNFAKTNEQLAEGENAVVLGYYSALDFSTVGITRFAKGYFRRVEATGAYVFKGNCTYNKKYGASFSFSFSYPVVG